MAIPASNIPFTSPRALIVDDSQIARYVLSMQLERLGFEVEVAESAESALRQLNAALPDVVFMDYLLPGIDGIEAVSRLRCQSRTVRLPIVMYTSQDSDTFAERARAVGVDDVYVKTDDETKLARILNRLALLPDRSRSSELEQTGNVRPLNREQSPAPTGKPGIPALDRKALQRLLEPSLESHHSRLRQELLAEFAILERYEERMRRDLFARVDFALGQASKRVRQTLQLDRSERQMARRRHTLASLSVAAAVLAGIVVSVMLAWNSAQRVANLDRATASVVEILEGNRQALATLRRDVMENEAPDSTAPVRPASIEPATRAYASAVAAEAPNAAEALVTELHSMGILGPVRVETGAGSFCITATPGGFELAGANVALRDCEPLPAQITVANQPR